MRKISGIAVMSGLLALPIAAQAQTSQSGADRKIVGAKVGFRTTARATAVPGTSLLPDQQPSASALKAL